MKALRYRTLVTTVAGEVTFNTDHLHGDLVSIHIKPATANNEYEVKITDPDGLELYETAMAVIGEIVESYDAEVVNEVLTIAITNALINEEFMITIRIRQFSVKG